MHPISLQATTPILELRGASSASLNALHPPPSANPTQRAICCRIFTPAALPEYPAASVRDYCSGAYTKEEVSETLIPEDDASPFIAATSADIRGGGDMAGYIPSKDYIALPPAAAFKSMESYYATTLHELGHWSGHETRLKRELSTRFGTESYAVEELVAELTSAFLCAELGVQGELRHSGYIDHWIKLLESDPRAIFTAATKASQAANYLRSLSEARNEVPCLG